MRIREREEEVAYYIRQTVARHGRIADLPDRSVEIAKREAARRTGFDESKFDYLDDADLINDLAEIKVRRRERSGRAMLRGSIAVSVVTVIAVFAFSFWPTILLAPLGLSILGLYIRRNV